MKWYHGTSKEAWKQIQEEGILFGRRYFQNKEVDRCTYLTDNINEARCYGEIVLEVEYDPLVSKNNNYCDGCWQMRVYEPISINNIKLI